MVNTPTPKQIRSAAPYPYEDVRRAGGQLACPYPANDRRRLVILPLGLSGNRRYLDRRTRRTFQTDTYAIQGEADGTFVKVG